MPESYDSPDLKLNAVVYATDFSPGAENAGAYAKLIAAEFSTKLIVAHAFTPTQAAMEVEAEQHVGSEQRKDLMARLSAKASTLSTEQTAATPVLLEGVPSDVIPGLADRNAPALLVLGTHGGGWLERSIVGSVAERILRSTTWPSMTVGPQVRPVSAETFPFKRILFATDFTVAAAEAAAFAVPMAKQLGAEMDVLHMVHEEALVSEEQLAELKNRFCSALEGLGRQLGADFCNPRAFVAEGSAHDRILEHIRQYSIDLLVLGLRKTSHPHIEKRVSGAFQIIADATCPVLTIRR
jgi:nucleotide-binding universal stress UspA family protein